MDRKRFQLAQGHGDGTQLAECGFCSSPLYADQPMIVITCAARDIFGCPAACRPTLGCQGYIDVAMHVGCSVHLDRSDHQDLRAGVDGQTTPQVKVCQRAINQGQISPPAN